MGCDIHFYVETRKSDEWITADVWEDGDVPYSKAFWDRRDYDLFAILANVRNSSGFVPVSEPRGVPDDACAEYRAVVGQWNGDGHSHSYFTLAELMAYDWTQVAEKTFSVDIGEYLKWRNYGRRQGREPGSWCYSTSSPTFPEAAVEAALEGLDEWELHHGNLDDEVARRLGHPVRRGIIGSPAVLTTWRVPYYRAAAPFLSETVPRLWRLGTPDAVRCCFFFDN